MLPPEVKILILYCNCSLVSLLSVSLFKLYYTMEIILKFPLTKPPTQFHSYSHPPTLTPTPNLTTTHPLSLHFSHAHTLTSTSPPTPTPPLTCTHSHLHIPSHSHSTCHMHTLSPPHPLPLPLPLHLSQGLGVGRGPGSTQSLIGDYSSSFQSTQSALRAPHRTPVQENIIMQEARNQRAFRDMTPLAGGIFDIGLYGRSVYE